MSSFRYADLFAGIGGFAAALETLGGECAYAVELDPSAAAVYRRNWGHAPCGARLDDSLTGDIAEDANEIAVRVPEHDVLVGGFPCQPFSKSGAQRGMDDETRGTLFWNILKIIQARRPKMVLLENVRNLAGPRHDHEWRVIIRRLRAQGYRVSDDPLVLSPHRLPRERGGRPQVRERVFIAATYDMNHPTGSEGDIPALDILNPTEHEWDLANDLPLEALPGPGTGLTADEVQWIDAWNDFVVTLWPHVRAKNSLPQEASLPGFPLWTDQWVTQDELTTWKRGGPRPSYVNLSRIPRRWDEVPTWKQVFLSKNAAFYDLFRDVLDDWLTRREVRSFPASKRKFEWQAQQAETLWECAIQARPSGLRAKRLTHVPALVAITQTSIVGPRRRRLSTREAARLQGFPDNFDFGDQSDAATYRQLGNGVNVGAVWNVLLAQAARDKDLLILSPEGRNILRAVESAPASPDGLLEGVVTGTRRRASADELAS